MKKVKSGFTMIELVFVIVVLGILAAIAVPKFAATRTDAQIAKGRSDVASIRSAIINERQSRLITGSHTWISKLHSSSSKYFDSNGSTSNSLLMYGVVPKDADGHWHGAAASGTKWIYKYKVGTTDVTFTYDPSKGTFDCDHTKSLCKKLTE